MSLEFIKKFKSATYIKVFKNFSQVTKQVWCRTLSLIRNSIGSTEDFSMNLTSIWSIFSIKFFLDIDILTKQFWFKAILQNPKKTKKETLKISCALHFFLISEVALSLFTFTLFWTSNFDMTAIQFGYITYMDFRFHPITCDVNGIRI